MLDVETERSPAPRPEVASEPPPMAPIEPPVGTADPSSIDQEAEPPEAAREQLDACRGVVVRETGARPDEVGLSAGAPDDQGTVLIDWSLGTGREGTCLVDASAFVLQFRR